MNKQEPTSTHQTKELSVTINLAMKAYSKKNKLQLENIQQELELHGISCAIIDGELVGVDGELCWSQQPGSAVREYYYNT